MSNKLPDNFAVFILTHGRPDNIKTLTALERHGYTGKVYLIVDNLDKSKDRYIEKYGDQVIVFDKYEAARTFDIGDNFHDMRAVVYARNASFDIAKKIGIKYFIQLDDDYTSFTYRFNNLFNYCPKVTRNLDSIFIAILDFYKSANITTIALSQGGDFIGGEGSDLAKAICLKRKSMNSFFCSTDRPFNFFGTINEDTTTYVKLGSIGKLFFSIGQFSLQQIQTQTNSKGLTDIYLSLGTYVKSFYTVMFHPSSVKISLMGNKDYRLHHAVSWENTVPKIINEDYKKS